MKKETIKRYVYSSLITFLAIFLPLVIGLMSEFDIQGITASSAVALLAVGVRILIKAVWETVIVLLIDLQRKINK